MGPYHYPPLPPAPPSKRLQQVMVVLLGVAALMLYGSVVTPVIYPAGQPWSGGVLLWQYGPHMLGGSGYELFFAVLLIANVAMIAVALLGAAKLLSGKLVIVGGCLAGVGALLSLFGVLFVLVALVTPELAVGLAVPLSLAANVLLMVISLSPSYRRAWARPAGGRPGSGTSAQGAAGETAAGPSPRPPAHSE